MQVYTDTPHIPLRPDSRFLPSEHGKKKNGRLILVANFFLPSVKDAFLTE
jgi:hypothetical protein